eukprot:2722805-Rhodomonas_salina.1
MSLSGVSVSVSGSGSGSVGLCLCPYVSAPPAPLSHPPLSCYSLSFFALPLSPLSVFPFPSHCAVHLGSLLVTLCSSSSFPHPPPSLPPFLSPFLSFSLPPLSSPTSLPPSDPLAGACPLRRSVRGQGRDATAGGQQVLPP